MGWNPSKTKTPTADALADLLEKAPWGKITAINLTRMARDGAVDLGWHTIDKDDTPSTVVAQLSSAATEDSEEVGGRFKYRATIRGMKKPPKGPEEETTLFTHTWDMGKGDPSESGGHQLLKEAAAFVKAQADAGDKQANAVKTMAETQTAVMQAQGSYMASLMEIGDKRTSVGPHHVRMLELTMQENERLRTRQDEREEARAERVAEAEADVRRMTMLSGAGDKLNVLMTAALPTLLDALQAASFQKRVDAAVRAKEAGIDVNANPPSPPRPPPPKEEPTETVIQICPMAVELDQIFHSASKEARAEIKEAVGENVWDLLVSSMAAETDNECQAILLNIRGYVKAMTKAKQNKLFSTLQQKLGVAAMKLDALFRRIGLTFE